MPIDKDINMQRLLWLPCLSCLPVVHPESCSFCPVILLEPDFLFTQITCVHQNQPVFHCICFSFPTFAPSKGSDLSKKKFRKSGKPKLKKSDVPCRCGKNVTNDFKNALKSTKINFFALQSYPQTNPVSEMCDRHEPLLATRLGFDVSEPKVLTYEW